MGMLHKNGLIYTGAGVLVIEDYYTKDGDIEPCIVLVRNKSSKLYMDFGGSYENSHDELKTTAVTELREESRNLININKKYLKHYANIPAGNINKQPTFYRSYIIKINGICKKYFDHNRKLIDKLMLNAPKKWKETDRLVHIPIRNINFSKLGIKGQNRLSDINGKIIELTRRTKNILYTSESMIHNIIKTKPIAKKSNIIIIKSNNFLNMTYSFN
jgi:hypothetical protein